MNEWKQRWQDLKVYISEQKGLFDDEYYKQILRAIQKEMERLEDLY